MCNWVASKRGQKRIEVKELKSMWNRNPDGGGIMFEHEGKVHIYKGFMEFDEFAKFYDHIHKKVNLDERASVIHFRISTTKSVNREQCHPFPITSEEKEFESYVFTDDVAYVHNGSINNFYGYKKKFSDTQNIGLFLFSKMRELDKEFYKKDFFKNWIEEVSQTEKDNYNRFAFLDKDGNIETVGDVSEHNGYVYANLNHVEYVSKNREFYRNLFKEGVVKVALIAEGYIHDTVLGVKTPVTETNMFEYGVDKDGMVFKHSPVTDSYVLSVGTEILDMEGTKVKLDADSEYVNEVDTILGY